MEKNLRQREGGEGRLPAMAPLANPYVPFQLENPPKYEARKALVRGTLFPGLDLPFLDMVNQEEKPVTPMTELQTLAFVLQELVLYLDTHRDDADALELYRKYQQMYAKGMAAYTQENGPINHTIPADGPYRWLDDPWPWEYTGNQEA